MLRQQLIVLQRKSRGRVRLTRRSIAFRPALSLVSFDPAGPSNR